MTNLLVAVTPGEHRFAPERVAHAARQHWTDVTYTGLDVTDPRLAELGPQLRISEGQRVVIANFHNDGEGIGVEGDDDIQAEFLALLTQNTTFPDGGIVVVHWADDVVPLRPHMTADDVRVLHG